MDTVINRSNNCTVNLSKYFLHGVALFIISYFVFLSQMSLFYWIFILTIVFIVPYSLVLLILVGGLNKVATEFIWPLKVKNSFENLIIQGFMVIMPTQILMFPFYFLLSQLPSSSPYFTLASLLAIFFLYVFMFGYIGITAARMHSEEYIEEKRRMKYEPDSSIGTRGKCTFCEQSYRYPLDKISDERTVRCVNCGHTFYLKPDEDLLKKLEELG